MSFRNAPMELVRRETNGVDRDWVHMVPRGEHLSLEEVPDGEGGTVWKWVAGIFNKEAMAAMVRSFAGPILIDYEHSNTSPDPAHSTAAAGWGEQVREVTDGLEVLSAWTPGGAAKVRGKEYRFLSPVIDGVWEQLDAEGTRDDPVIFRPRFLREAGLTNRPKLEGKLRPLVNKKPGEDPAPNQKAKSMKTILPLLAGLLSVPADSLTEDNVEQKITDFIDALATLRNKAQRVDDLEEQVATLTTERLDADIAAHKEVIEDEAAARALFKADRKNALAVFGELKKKAPGDGEPPHATIHHKTRAPKEAAGKAASEKIAHRAAEIANKEKCSLSEAQQRAEAELG